MSQERLSLIENAVRNAKTWGTGWLTQVQEDLHDAGMDPVITKDDETYAFACFQSPDI